MKSLFFGVFVECLCIDKELLESKKERKKNSEDDFKYSYLNLFVDSIANIILYRATEHIKIKFLHYLCHTNCWKKNWCSFKFSLPYIHTIYVRDSFNSIFSVYDKYYWSVDDKNLSPSVNLTKYNSHACPLDANVQIFQLYVESTGTFLIKYFNII